MIALGRWGFTVDTFVFRGSPVIDVFEKNGQYSFSVVEPEIATPEIEIVSLTESGNVIDAVVVLPSMKKFQVKIHAVFSGDTFTADAVIPVFGKIELKDGHRV
ncbi:MAG: hypothetical protein K6B52_09495 [Clostridiales bacterium]|nr:hypothetical protein [Clostridiales bacterium]